MVEGGEGSELNALSERAEGMEWAVECGSGWNENERGA